MTDSEIIKALTICLTKRICDGCPLRSQYATGKCRFEAKKSALDLINRQKAEIENYKQIAEHQQLLTLERGFEIKRLKEMLGRTTDTKRTATLLQALNTFGIDNQTDIAIEEMSELTKALIKHRRYNTDETKEQIREEIADVQIMLLQLMIAYGCVDKIIESKINRLEQRIKEHWIKLRAKGK